MNDTNTGFASLVQLESVNSTIAMLLFLTVQEVSHIGFFTCLGITLASRGMPLTKVFVSMVNERSTQATSASGVSKPQ